MLKIISLLLFTTIIYNFSAISQETEKRTNDNKTVTPDVIHEKETLKTESIDASFKNERKSKEQSKSNTTEGSSEYPKKLTVGNKRSEVVIIENPELTKEQEIIELEKSIISGERKINTLKESGDLHTEEIKRRQDIIDNMKAKLESLKK